MKQYTCVHVNKGSIEVKASSSYGAAQEAAKQWKLKSTSGIDAYLHTEEGQTL
jgi:hypothetical protein